MSLFKKSYLKRLRVDLVKESGRDISDEDWNKVIQKVEDDYRKKLEETLPKAFWFSLYEIAEKGDVILEIDGKNIGEEIRQLRRIYEWLKQRKIYFGW